MKKAISILLVAVMVFAIAACAGGGDNAKSQQQSPPPAASVSAVPSPSQSADNEETSPSGTAGGASGTIGFVTDDVDHWAREPYDIVYYNYTNTNFTAQITDILTNLGEKYNFNLEQLSANADGDFYISNLHTILNKEPDGLLINLLVELAPRVSEIVQEYNVPTVAMMIRAMDAEGRMVLPSVVVDQYEVGRRQVQFLKDVYKDYWGDIDSSEIALLVLDMSSNVEFTRRTEGAKEKWDELFPNQQYFYGDTATYGLTAEGGYTVTNSILSANPGVKYWFIVGTAEDLVLGGTRAVEALGKEDTVLITSIGVSVLPSEWDNGYEGSWIAIYWIPPAMYAGTAVFGLLAMIDGRATMDTLWPEYKAPGDKAACFTLDIDMVTRDRYKTYLYDINSGFGI